MRFGDEFNGFERGVGEVDRHIDYSLFSIVFESAAVSVVQSMLWTIQHVLKSEE